MFLWYFARLFKKFPLLLIVKEGKLNKNFWFVLMQIFMLLEHDYYSVAHQPFLLEQKTIWDKKKANAVEKSLASTMIEQMKIEELSMRLSAPANKS